MSTGTPGLLVWESSADSATGAPMIAMTWEHKTRLYPIDRALATARDLFAAAAAAESDAAVFAVLTEDLDAKPDTARGALAQVRRRRTGLQESPGARPILRIGAAYNAEKRRPFVAIHSGTLDAHLSCAEARAEALKIHEGALAAVMDARTRHVLAERGLDSDAIEAILAEVCALGNDNGLLT